MSSLKDKAKTLDFSKLPGIAAPDAPTPGASLKPRTAPGLLMAHANEQRSALAAENEALKGQVQSLSETASRVDSLRAELKEWEGSRPTRLLDPNLIARSRWANRDERHFQTVAFEQLKEEIASAGGNVQPIKVRPLAGTMGEGARYELVFGHRRCEACRQLGLPVLALVESVDDRSLFIDMDRENRARNDLSPWEQGAMYRKALREGLFTSNRKLAEAIGADLTNVGRALALADLPEAVVTAFGSPLDLQYRWASDLRRVCEEDPDGVASRAERLRTLSPKPAPKVIFDALIARAGQGGSTVLPPPNAAIQMGSVEVGSVAVDASGRAKISLQSGVLTADRVDALARHIERFLAATNSGDKSRRAGG